MPSKSEYSSNPLPEIDHLHTKLDLLIHDFLSSDQSDYEITEELYEFNNLERLFEKLSAYSAEDTNKNLDLPGLHKIKNSDLESHGITTLMRKAYNQLLSKDPDGVAYLYSFSKNSLDKWITVKANDIPTVHVIYSWENRSFNLEKVENHERSSNS